MAKSKGKKEAEKQYKKELRRIQQFVRRAEQRGYEFEPDFLPKRPKTITEASVNRLHKITPDKLYAKATYVDSTGAIHKGRVKHEDLYIKKGRLKGVEKDYNYPHPRTKRPIDWDKVPEPKRRAKTIDEQVQEALQKGIERHQTSYEERHPKKDKTISTRKKPQYDAEKILKNKQHREQLLRDYIAEDGVNSQRAKTLVDTFPSLKKYYDILQDDEYHKAKLNEQPEYREQFNEGSLIYDNILHIIDNWRTGGYDKACDFVQGKIDEAIEIVGKDVAMNNLANALNLKENIDKAIYYLDKNEDKADSALSEIIEAILQRPMTADESQHFSALLEDRIAEREKYYQYTGDEF